jgi:hypothetical protein
MVLSDCAKPLVGAVKPKRIIAVVSVFIRSPASKAEHCSDTVNVSGDSVVELDAILGDRFEKYYSDHKDKESKAAALLGIGTGMLGRFLIDARLLMESGVVSAGVIPRVHFQASFV